MLSLPTSLPAVTPKLQYIDALRGWAILGVIMLHTSQYGTGANYLHPTLKAFLANGAHGVQLFFVVSASTLFLSYSQREGEQYLIRNFFIRRLFRIAPMYWLGALFFVPWFLLVEMRDITVGQVVSNVLFVHGFNPNWINSAVPGGWSIAVEMTFYCLVPWLATQIKTLDQAVRLVVGAWLLNGALTLALLAWPPVSSSWVLNSYLYFYFPSQLPVFGLGIVLFFWLRPGYREDVNASTLLGLSVVILANLALGLAQHQKHVWFALGFVVLAKALSEYPIPFLVNQVLAYLGRISFSLYLVHFAVLLVMKHYGVDEFLHPTRMLTALADYGVRYLVVLIVGSVIATGCYYLVELPCIRLGQRLIARLNLRRSRYVEPARASSHGNFRE